MSTGLTAVSAPGVAQLGVESGQKPSVENDFAWRSPPGRLRTSASPCTRLEPDLVTMFRAGPEDQPNLDANGLVSTWNSMMKPTSQDDLPDGGPHSQVKYLRTTRHAAALR